MNDLILTDNMFISNGYYTQPWKDLDQLSEKTIYEMCAVFDQNGYKMTDIEVLYCNKNFPDLCSKYRPHFDGLVVLQIGLLNHLKRKVLY